MTTFPFHVFRFAENDQTLTKLKAALCRISLIYLIGLFSAFPPESRASQSIEDQFDQLKKSAAECLNNSDSDCKDAFEACAAFLSELENDTLAGNYYLDLANMRMRAGRWNEISLDLFQKAHLRFQASGKPCKIVESQFALTRYARFKGNSDRAVKLANDALEAAKKCGNPSDIARAEVFIGSAYLLQSNYAEALDHFQQAEKKYIEIGDSLGMGGLYLDMSMLYAEMHEKAKARTYTKRASDIYRDSGEDIKYAIALIDLSADLIDIKLADSALTYLAMAQPIITGKHQRAEAYMEQNYGSAYYLLDRHREAIEHYKKGLELIEPVGDKGLMVLLNNFISESYRKTDQPQKAHQYALISDSISQQIPKNFKRSQSLLSLAESAYLVKDYDLSYKSFKRFIVLRDSLLGAEKRKEIASLEQEFEAEKKETEIALQKKENDLLLEKNLASRNRNIALAILAVLIAALAIALISRQRNKARFQASLIKLKEAENEKLNQELAYRTRELTSKALFIAQNNELINDLKNQLEKIATDQQGHEVKNIVNDLNVNTIQTRNWEAFTSQFEELNPAFYRSLTSGDANLTKSEIRLAALLRMGFSSKEIANMLNISEDGIKKARYRLRKKMNLNTEESLEAFIMQV